jgi:hypothetical protein
VQAISEMSSHDVNFDSVLLVCNLCDTQGSFYSQLNECLHPMRNNPVVPFLLHKATPMEGLFDEAESKGTPEATAQLVHAILQAEVQPTFHKINVHAAMSPTGVLGQLEPVFRQAKDLREACLQRARRKKVSVKSRPSSGSDNTNTTDSEITPFITVSIGRICCNYNIHCFNLVGLHG